MAVSIIYLKSRAKKYETKSPLKLFYFEHAEKNFSLTKYQIEFVDTKA